MTAQATPRPAGHGASTAAGRPLMTASGVEKSYRRGIWPARHAQAVLKGANLELLPGEVVGLVGENGSGKSTLLAALAGDLSPDRGDIDMPPMRVAELAQHAPRSALPAIDYVLQADAAYAVHDRHGGEVAPRGTTGRRPEVRSRAAGAQRDDEKSVLVQLRPARRRSRVLPLPVLGLARRRGAVAARSRARKSWPT